jgi:hypothetical protein
LIACGSHDPSTLPTPPPATTVPSFDPAGYLADCNQLVTDYQHIQDLEHQLNTP